MLNGECRNISSFRRKVNNKRNLFAFKRRWRFVAAVRLDLKLVVSRTKEWSTLPRWTVWPVKSCQMSIKIIQKWFHFKNERFWHLYKNCLKHGRFGQNNYCHWLWKVDQTAINRPIWSHWRWTACAQSYKRSVILNYNFIFTLTRKSPLLWL